MCIDIECTETHPLHTYLLLTVTTLCVGTDVTVMTGDDIMQDIQAHQRTITRTMNHAYHGDHLSSSASSLLPTPPPSLHSGDNRPGSAGADIVPSSSPELEDEPMSTGEPYRMKGLKLITQNTLEMCQDRSMSPPIPIIKPTPRRGELGLYNIP